MLDPAVFLQERRPCILDGGLATTLEERGCQLDHNLWSAALLLDAPKEIRDVHAAFLRAGARVIESASYQFSFSAARRAGWTRQQGAEALRKSVILVEEAVRECRLSRDSVLLAASLGPFGATLGDGSEYTGSLGGHSLEEVRQHHLERVAVLCETTADVLAFETLPLLAEARIILDLMRGFPAQPYWLSFQLRSTGRLGGGEELDTLLDELHQADNLVALGINCSSPEVISSTLPHLLPRLRCPLLLYPNRGEVYESGAWHGDDNLDSFLSHAASWWSRGVSGIGGCCRINPTAIEALAQAAGT